MQSTGIIVLVQYKTARNGKCLESVLPGVVVVGLDGVRLSVLALQAHQGIFLSNLEYCRWNAGTSDSSADTGGHSRNECMSGLR